MVVKVPTTIILPCNNNFFAINYDAKFCQPTSKNNPNFFWPILGKVVKGLTTVLDITTFHVLRQANFFLDNANTSFNNCVHSPLYESLPSYSYFQDTLPYVAANIKGYLS